jgi:hypothetical protein
MIERIGGENLYEPMLTPPPGESLNAPEDTQALWGDRTGLQAQVRTHQRNVSAIANMDEALGTPGARMDTSLVDVGLDSPILAGYNVLSEVLEDPEHQRVALYLPFELLPHKDWKTVSKDAAEITDRFKEAYVAAWDTLLGIHDVRANFTNGDILEHAHRDGELDRVVKAAHLAPFIVARGVVEQAYVDQLAYGASDPLLRSSIQESYNPAARDKTTDVYAVPAAALTPERLAWVERETASKVFHDQAVRVARELLAGRAVDQSKLPPEVYERAVFNVITHVAQQDFGRAQGVYVQHKALFEIGADDVSENRGEIISKLGRLGIITDAQSALPNLAGPWSQNMEQMSADIEVAHELAASIMKHEYLSERLFPITLLGGSRLKGYGTATSDTDAGVIVRPEVSPDERDRIRAELKAIAPTGQDFVEYWTLQDGDMLRIRNLMGSDNHTAKSYWAHGLFNAVWVGDEASITGVQASLLPSFFTASTELRGQSLERLEQDALQYRLLHSGYDRHYPRYDTRGGSAFWDAGYRRLATQLFVDTVFLPKLP